MNHITISGGYYMPKQTLELFKSNKQVASIIYGKNGSGKSSIARAIKQSLIGQLDKTEFDQVDFFLLKQHPGQGIDSVAYSKPSVPCYVHNEKFTEDNVLINDDGLNTIVIFGEQIEISNEIDRIDNEILNVSKHIDFLEERKLELENVKNPDAYLFDLALLRKGLKETWAERDRILVGKKIAGKVDKALEDDILNMPLSSNENLRELQETFKEELKIYNSVKDSERLNELRKLRIPEDIINLVELLAVKVPYPNLSENERKIFDIIHNTEEFKVKETRLLLTGNNDICPKCLSILDDSHKKDSLMIINKILNTQEANLFMEKLNQFNISQHSLCLKIPEEISELISLEDKKCFLDLESNFNENLIILEQMKQEKVFNPYFPIKVDLEGFREILKGINSYLEKFNKVIAIFNDRLYKKDSYKNQLKQISKKIARKEFEHLISSYHQKLDVYKVLVSDLSKNQLIKNRLELQKKEKQDSLANVEIALDLINGYLNYIFYDESRLYLKCEDDKYKVMSRGLSVKPSSLSIGEKNIISLCYFFSTLFTNESISELFSKKSLLVLDDPLSSFDFENKVGVYSFLRYILGELHSKNSESKSLVLTHDLDVLYNLAKVYDDIGIKENDKLKLFHLSHKQLHEIKTKNFDEYSLLVQNIYDFSQGSQDNMNEINIGNSMRRVLEAFSTFNYKCGIDGISKNPDILSKLEEHQKAYFKNSMYRLILNSESHLQERSKQIINTMFKEHFSTEEKIKTAKDILMFLYILDPLHLKVHLKKDGSDSELMCAQIQIWIDETFDKEKVSQIS